MTEPDAFPPRRRMVTTRRVRRAVTVELTPRRAVRLGLRLLLAGSRAARHGRPVRLTLKSAAHVSRHEERAGDGTVVDQAEATADERVLADAGRVEGDGSPSAAAAERDAARRER